MLDQVGGGFLPLDDKDVLKAGQRPCISFCDIGRGGTG